MNKEIGNFNGVSVMVNPETYEDIKKQKTIYENKILKELQQRIDKAIEYIKNNNLYEETRLDYDIDDEPFYWDCDDNKAKNDLLDILRGKE